MKYSKELQCWVSHVSYDPKRQTGIAVFKEGNCCDMQGCIDFFKRFHPDVSRIETYAATARDTIYILEDDGKWWSYTPLPEGRLQGNEGAPSHGK